MACAARQYVFQLILFLSMTTLHLAASTGAAVGGGNSNVEHQQQQHKPTSSNGTMRHIPRQLQALFHGALNPNRAEHSLRQMMGLFTRIPQLTQAMQTFAQSDQGRQMYGMVRRAMSQGANGLREAMTNGTKIGLSNLLTTVSSSSLTNDVETQQQQPAATASESLVQRQARMGYGGYGGHGGGKHHGGHGGYGGHEKAMLPYQPTSALSQADDALTTIGLTFRNVLKTQKPRDPLKDLLPLLFALGAMIIARIPSPG